MRVGSISAPRLQPYKAGFADLFISLEASTPIASAALLFEIAVPVARVNARFCQGRAFTIT